MISHMKHFFLFIDVPSFYVTVLFFTICVFVDFFSGGSLLSMFYLHVRVGRPSLCVPVIPVSFCVHIVLVSVYFTMCVPFINYL